MRILYALFGTIVAACVVLYPIVAVTYSQGPPPGLSGAPGELTCIICHDSFDENSGTGSVIIMSPDTYLPGETIQVTVTVVNTTPTPEPRQGFQISAKDAGGNNAGQWVLLDAVNTRFAGVDISTHVTHTLEGTEQTTWTMAWTAPPVPLNEVTFYAAGNAANGDFSIGGDYIYTTSRVVNRSTVSTEADAVPQAARLISVYPNPIRESATVAYELAEAGSVTVTLYDGLGRAVQLVEQGSRPAGASTVRFDARDLAAGTYFVEVRAADVRQSRPVVVVR
jgi:hypothetical protein